MRALMVERYSPATQAFMEGLNAATGSSVDHAESVDEAVRTMLAMNPELLIINLDQLHGEAWSVADRLRREACDAMIRCPHMILLSSAPQPVGDAARCRDLQAMCMLQAFWPPIFEEARIALWMRRRKKYRSTLRILLSGGHHTVHFCTGTFSRQLRVPSRPAKMAAIMAGRLDYYSVEQLADQLEVCRQTVKKYIYELRRASLEIQREVKIPDPDEGIFWMERRPGGTICGVKANGLRG